MKALTYGRFRGLDGNAALFDLATGPAAAPLATLRIAILERDIGRVTLRRPNGYRLDRGWAIAPEPRRAAVRGTAARRCFRLCQSKTFGLGGRRHRHARR